MDEIVAKGKLDFPMYRQIVVDGIIVDPTTNRILMQRRSDTRRLFPGHWEFPGGHLEDQETLATCLKRELKEETGMEVLAIGAMVHSFTWEEDPSVINFQFMVKATGTFKAEPGKISEYRWVDEFELDAIFPADASNDENYQGARAAFIHLRTR